MNTQKIKSEVDTIKEIVDGLVKTEIYKGEIQTPVKDSKKMGLAIGFCIAVILIGLIAYLTWWGVQ